MYLDKNLFSQKAILIQQNARDQNEALKQITTELLAKDVVTAEFLPAIIKREQNYPTGLALKDGLGVAIPHTDSDKVKQEQLGFISLRKPVTFRQMGDLDTNIKVGIIFVLCLKSPDNQLQMLQNLMKMFADEQVMSKIVRAQSEDQFLQIFA